MPGQSTNEGQDAGEQDGVARRLSAGLSMRYEAAGEHCPIYSKMEAELMVQRRLDEETKKFEAKLEEQQKVFEAKLQEAEERAAAAEAEATATGARLASLEEDVNGQINEIEAAFSQRMAESNQDLQMRDIQLKALSAQLHDATIKMATQKQELDEATRKLGQVDVEKMRIEREWAERLEQEKLRRRQDVSNERERITRKAREQFEVANAQYVQLEHCHAKSLEELQHTTAELNHLKAENTDMLRFKDKLEAQLAQVETELVSLRASTAKKDEDIASLNATLESKLAESRAAVEQANEAVTEAHRNRDAAFGSVASLFGENQALKEEVARMQVAVAEAQRKEAEVNSMCEQLLAMLEKKQEEEAAAAGGQR